ncbi:MAG: glutathione S-transferase family protein [Rhizobiales bacterium]|nr:glutathione S-transferase family protein [Hyphomicrobiales bacterium]
MSLTLYMHPLSSYCHKAMIALYENATPFTAVSVNLGDPDERAMLLKLWGVGKFPVLEDDARGEVVPESSIIIEYLDRHYPGATRLIPADGDAARAVRFADRFYDLHIHNHMQKVVGNRLRPAGAKDPHGVEDAKTRMRAAYDIAEREMASLGWAAGDDFSMADCAAAPALFYAAKVLPYADTHPHLAAYLERLKARPSYARVLKEAEPYFHMFPQEG